MTPVITIALPVFAIIAAGLAAGRLSLMDGGDAQVLNKFVFRFAMPVALFGLTARTAPPGAGDAAIVFSYGAAAVTVIIGAYFFSKTVFSLSGPEAGAHGFASTLGNAVFLGLPIALTIDGWGRPFVMLMLVEGTIIITIGAALMTARGDVANLSFARTVGKFLAGPLRNPLVAAVAAGFIYSALGLPLPAPAASFLDIFGRAAGPTALFSLGLFLATHKFPAIGAVAGRVSSIAFAKMALLPGIAIGAALMFGVGDPHQLGALSLFTLVPTGVGAFIMASQYGVYSTETAAAVSVTTVLSVLTISAVLALFA